MSLLGSGEESEQRYDWQQYIHAVKDNRNGVNVELGGRWLIYSLKCVWSHVKEDCVSEDLVQERGCWTVHIEKNTSVNVWAFAFLGGNYCFAFLVNDPNWLNKGDTSRQVQGPVGCAVVYTPNEDLLVLECKSVLEGGNYFVCLFVCLFTSIGCSF